VTNLSRKNVDPIRRALPFAEWPEQDQLAWTAAISPGGLFDDPGPAAHWRPATRKSYLFSYGRWLRFLALCYPHDWALDAVARLSHDRITEYVKLLHDQGLNPTTIWGYLSDLQNVVYNIYADVDWSWLREIVNRLHLNVRPRPNLETQLVPIQDLYEAGLALIQQSESKRPRRPSCVHVDYRDGLMIALLATVLLRIKNFAEIKIGNQLIQTPNGYVMTFQVEEIKNKQYVELEIHDPLIPILERYLTYHRPALLDGQESAFLWISKEGHRMRDHHVSKRMVKVTMREIGKPISPHLFRHCAATSISETSPELTRIIKPLLVHIRATTGERYYNRSSVLKASRRHSDVIEKLKAELAETDILETTS
jgi:integrase/recombinase XerD